MQKLKVLSKHLRYSLEFIAVILFYITCRLMPLRASSALFGKIARLFGPYAAISKIARRNIQRVFTNYTHTQVEHIVYGMWENMGRTFGEYPHLHTLKIWSTKSHVSFVNSEIVDVHLKNQTPIIFVLCHLGNWEYATLGAIQKGLKIAQLYRTLNNPYVDALVSRVHSGITPQRVTKGSEGARQLLATLKQGFSVSMLVDQKYNEGVSVPFCGINAMTAPAYARMALRFKCPIIPVRVQRVKGIDCQVTYYPAIDTHDMGLSERTIYNILNQVNALFSSWIQECPQDWLWVHNRWPKS